MITFVFIGIILGLWAGLGRIDFSKEGNSEFDWGASLTLLTLKF